jgi:hypothetical protein
MTLSRRSFSLAASLMVASGLTVAAFAASARADAPAGQPAPSFAVTTASGEAISLSDFAGQTVVLEWTNHGCPYVQRHYNSGHMQGLQARAADEETVWIQVISSAPGEQGYVLADEALALNTERDAGPAHVILDPEGTLGRAYDARTTPHMYVIDGEGVVQYAGAIDDQPRPRPNSPEPVDYVGLALDAVAAGETPDPAETQAYGCNVKYAY